MKILESVKGLPYSMTPEDLIAYGRDHIDPEHWDRKAIESFEAGIDYEPPHFKYGLGAEQEVS